MTALDVYGFVAALLAISTIPVVGECLIEAATPSADNRLGALMWATLCLTVCVLWPLALAGAAFAGLHHLAVKGR